MPPSGSAGLGEFVRSLRATWPRLLLRFTLVFVVSSVAWWILAPYYATTLAALGHALKPLLEAAPATVYSVEGAKVWTVRFIAEPGAARASGFKAELWRGYANYNLSLFAALILATPGWSWRQRIKFLAVGLALLSLAEFAFFLVTVEYTQLRPLPGRFGVFVPPGFSQPRQIVVTWTYYFFQIMGRGLFPLLLYYAVLGIAWRPPTKQEPEQGELTAARHHAVE